MSEQEIIKKNNQISSRVIMVYFVVFLWVFFGVFGAHYQPTNESGEQLPKANFASLAVYFISLTGFVGAYIYGSTVKPKKNTSPIFLKGNTDRREILVYVCIILWTFLGVWGVVQSVSLEEIGAYFGSLTPFVAAYILGETMRNSGAARPATIDETNEQI